jgi:hypothetical protein
MTFTEYWAEVRAAHARVQASAAELMVKHDDLSVDQCLVMAWMLEFTLHGQPGASKPLGIVQAIDR